MNVGQLLAQLQKVDPSLPVTVMSNNCPQEVWALVEDSWYIPAEESGVIFVGPHCLLHMGMLDLIPLLRRAQHGESKAV